MMRPIPSRLHPPRWAVLLLFVSTLLSSFAVAQAKPAGQLPASVQGEDRSPRPEALQPALQRRILDACHAWLRGDADVFKHEAELRWELALHDERARRMGLPAVSLIDNRDRLLSRQQQDEVLRSLEEERRRCKRLEVLGNLEADFRLQEAEERIAKLAVARSTGSISLQDYFAGGKPDSGLTEWELQRKRVRPEEVLALELQLMRAVNASDADPLLIRRRDVLLLQTKLSEKMGEGAVLLAEAHRARPNLAEQIAQKVEIYKDALIQKPAEVPKLRAALKLLCRELTDGNQADSLAKKLVRWVPAAQLEQMRAELEPTLKLLLQIQPDILGRRDIHIHDIRELKDAVDGELLRRQESGNSASMDLGKLSDETLRSLRARAETPLMGLLRTQEGRAAWYHEFERLDAAGVVPAALVEKDLRYLHLQGRKDQIELLEDAHTSLRNSLAGKLDKQQIEKAMINLRSMADGLVLAIKNDRFLAPADSRQLIDQITEKVARGPPDRLSERQPHAPVPKSPYDGLWRFDVDSLASSCEEILLQEVHIFPPPAWLPEFGLEMPTQPSRQPRRENGRHREDHSLMLGPKDYPKIAGGEDNSITYKPGQVNTVLERVTEETIDAARSIHDRRGEKRRIIERERPIPHK